MTVRLSGRLICATADEAATVRRCLAAHLALTRAEPGCMAFSVTETDDPMVWRVEESFVDRAAFEAHQSRTAGSDWAAQTRLIRRDYRVTEE